MAEPYYRVLVINNAKDAEKKLNQMRAEGYRLDRIFHYQENVVDWCAFIFVSER